MIDTTNRKTSLYLKASQLDNNLQTTMINEVAVVGYIGSSITAKLEQQPTLSSHLLAQTAERASNCNPRKNLSNRSIYKGATNPAND